MDENYIVRINNTFNEETGISSGTSEIVKCIICGENATKQKMGKDICEYHYELANDHKRGR
jgi:hypothetical protein